MVQDIKQTPQQEAQQYSESIQYDITLHDEGGFGGIDTEMLTTKLISFHQQQQTKACNEKLIGILENLTYWENIPETWKLEINAFLKQQQPK